MDRIILLIKENIRLLIGTLVVLFALVLIITLALTGKKTATTKISDQVYKLEIADSDKERQIGLSGRNSLEQNRGMVFLFDTPDYYSFWMKDMKFPIDIIYINENKVVTVVKNATPPSSKNENPIIYQPDEKANKVLEIKAGSADKYNITKGTKIEIENL